MQTVNLVLVGSHGMDLDSVPLQVHDSENCSREVLAALPREKWVLSVGDRIEIREPGTEGEYDSGGERTC